MLPKRLHRNSQRQEENRRSRAHRQWVRGHACSVPGCQDRPIECAHVRSGSDGGIGLKPSDIWTISLCREHHAEQHRLGEAEFQLRHGIDLRALAEEFARRSPHRNRWSEVGAAGRPKVHLSSLP